MKLVCALNTAEKATDIARNLSCLFPGAFKSMPVDITVQGQVFTMQGVFANSSAPLEDLVASSKEIYPTARWATGRKVN